MQEGIEPTLAQPCLTHLLHQIAGALRDAIEGRRRQYRGAQ